MLQLYPPSVCKQGNAKFADWPMPIVGLKRLVRTTHNGKIIDSNQEKIVNDKIGDLTGVRTIGPKSTHASGMVHAK